MQRNRFYNGIVSEIKLYQNIPQKYWKRHLMKLEYFDIKNHFLISENTISEIKNSFW